MAVLLLVTVSTAPPAADAQHAAKLALVGILFVNDLPLLFETFRQTLQELGYAEGRNLSLEYRSAKGQPDQLGGLAAELVRLKVDVIFAPSTTAALAARRSTQTIPIVFATAGDPVGTGLVTSVAYPGGNVTGMSSMAPDLAAKRLEFLKQLVPGMSRVAFVWRDAPVGRAQLRQTEAAARALGIPVEPLEIRTAGDLEKVFQAAVAQRADALVVPRSPISFPHRARIADLALRHRLPAVYDDIEFAEAGGLMTYGPSLREGYRRAATFVDKILKGANPRNLPVEQPTKFELVLNTKTAKALGLTIPQSVLLRADQIIE